MSAGDRQPQHLRDMGYRGFDVHHARGGADLRRSGGRSPSGHAHAAVERDTRRFASQGAVGRGVAIADRRSPEAGIPQAGWDASVQWGAAPRHWTEVPWRDHAYRDAGVQAHAAPRLCGHSGPYGHASVAQDAATRVGRLCSPCGRTGRCAAPEALLRGFPDGQRTGPARQDFSAIVDRQSRLVRAGHARANASAFLRRFAGARRRLQLPLPVPLVCQLRGADTSVRRPTDRPPSRRVASTVSASGGVGTAVPDGRHGRDRSTARRGYVDFGAGGRSFGKAYRAVRCAAGKT